MLYPKKAVCSVVDEELVEFNDVIREKGNEASNVAGPEGNPAKSFVYVANKPRGSFR